MAGNIKLDKATLVEKVYQTHRAVQKAYTFNSHFIEYEKIKIARAVSFTKAGNTRRLELTDEVFTHETILLYPESAEYLFHIEGIAKKLFLFLLIHYVNPRTNQFLFNAQVIADFNAYHKILDNREATASNINQGLRKLVKGNIIQNVERGRFMLNPLVAGGMTLNGRRTLIQEYSQLLITKGKDPVLDFYPKFYPE